MGDIVSWIAVGLVAGGLASALRPGLAPLCMLAVVTIGVVGGLLGGWGWAALFGSGPAAFLGSAIVAVSGALAVVAGLRQRKPGRYQV